MYKSVHIVKAIFHNKSESGNREKVENKSAVWGLVKLFNGKYLLADWRLYLLWNKRNWNQSYILRHPCPLNLPDTNLARLYREKKNTINESTSSFAQTSQSSLETWTFGWNSRTVLWPPRERVKWSHSRGWGWAAGRNWEKNMRPPCAIALALECTVTHTLQSAHWWRKGNSLRLRCPGDTSLLYSVGTTETVPSLGPRHRCHRWTNSYQSPPRLIHFIEEKLTGFL